MVLVASAIWCQGFHVLQEHCSYFRSIVAKSVFASGNLLFEAEFFLIFGVEDFTCSKSTAPTWLGNQLLQKVLPGATRVHLLPPGGKNIVVEENYKNGNPIFHPDGCAS